MRRALQLVLGCVVLGAGIGLLLRAQLGSDGFSLAAFGLARRTGLPFGLVNAAVGLTMVGLAAALGVRPGAGTLVQPVVVGFAAQLTLDVVPAPPALLTRGAMLVAAMAVLAIGIAAYLAAGLGAGPLEALSTGLADRAQARWGGPRRFAAAYSCLQLVLAGTGWAFGAAPGVGTVAVVAGLGPAVARLLPLLTPAPGAGPPVPSR